MLLGNVIVFWLMIFNCDYIFTILPVGGFIFFLVLGARELKKMEGLENESK